MGKKILSTTSPYASFEPILKRDVFHIGGSFPYALPSFTDTILKYLLKIPGTSRIFVEHTSHRLLPPSLKVTGYENLKRVDRQKISNSYPPFHCIRITYSESDGTRTSKGSSLQNEAEAVQKAYGEYLERFTGRYELDASLKSFPSPKRLSLSHTSLRVSQLPRPIKTQEIHPSFPKHDQDLEQLNGGVAWNSSKNRNEMLPLSCLYYRVPDTLHLHHQTTSGLGGGLSIAAARLSAIYELIERDHFLLYWLAGLSPERIDNQSLPSELRDYIGAITKRYQLQIYFLNTSYELPLPSITCVIIDPVLKRIALGGAAGRNAQYVLEKAFTEALTELNAAQSAPWIEYRTQSAFNIPLDQNQRRNFYNSSEGIAYMHSHFLRGNIVPFEHMHSPSPFADIQAELQHVISLFRNLSKERGDGYNLYFHEYEGPLLETFGYYVSRAFIPSFLKLWLEEDKATPWSSRIQDFAKHKGVVIADANDLNPYPHPFS